MGVQHLTSAQGDHAMETVQQSKRMIDTIILLCCTLLVFWLAGKYDVLETLVEMTREYEAFELDEIIPTAGFLGLGLLVFSLRRWNEARV